MNRTVTFAAAVLTIAASVSAHAGDQVVASFERMLDHEAFQGATATTVRAEADPLVAALVLPLREGRGASVAPMNLATLPNASDPVVASFTRLFEHQPGAYRPILPANEAADPLVAAVMVPLREVLTVQMARSHEQVASR